MVCTYIIILPSTGQIKFWKLLFFSHQNRQFDWKSWFPFSLIEILFLATCAFQSLNRLLTKDRSHIWPFYISAHRVHTVTELIRFCISVISKQRRGELELVPSKCYQFLGQNSIFNMIIIKEVYKERVRHYTPLYLDLSLLLLLQNNMLCSWHQ